MSARLSLIVAARRDLRAARATLAKRARLEQLFRALPDPDDLRRAATWLAGDVGPPAGVGPALVFEALSSAPPVSAAAAPLTLAEVEGALTALVAVGGAGATARRLELLHQLLGRADADERELLGALLVGELRQGAGAGVIQEALARALEVEPKALRRAVMLAGSLGTVAAAARREGAQALARARLTPLVAVAPMLASTAGPLDETIAALGGEAAAEWKLDGVRVQVHRRGAEVRVFTRSLRDVTATQPQLVALARALPLESVVLDGEVVLLGPSGRPAPFQELMRRFERDAPDEPDEPEESGEPEKSDEPGELGVMFFDLLELDGQVLIDHPDRERRAALERLLPPERRVPRRIVRDADQARAALADALAHGHEGVLLKSLAAPYAAGRRGASWRKLKPARTVDLVILAAEWGHGRRQGWLSNLHLGARDPQDPTRFVMVGKTFKGLTDAMLRELTETLPPLAVKETKHLVRVRPERVVEIAFEGTLASSRYPGGIALRFARVKRFRPDKPPAEATTLDELRAFGPSRDEPAG